MPHAARFPCTFRLGVVTPDYPCCRCGRSCLLRVARHAVSIHRILRRGAQAPPSRLPRRFREVHERASSRRPILTLYPNALHEVTTPRAVLPPPLPLPCDPRPHRACAVCCVHRPCPPHRRGPRERASSPSHHQWGRHRRRRLVGTTGSIAQVEQVEGGLHLALVDRIIRLLGGPGRAEGGKKS